MSNPNNNNSKDFVAISLKDSSVSYPPNSKLFCNLCGCNLILLDVQNEEWFCNRCHVSYFPDKGEKVKRANKFETPHKQDSKVLVSMVEDSPTTAAPTKPVFPRSLDCLKRPGVTITGFNSTVDNESL